MYLLALRFRAVAWQTSTIRGGCEIVVIDREVQLSVGMDKRDVSCSRQKFSHLDHHLRIEFNYLDFFPPVDPSFANLPAERFETFVGNDADLPGLLAGHMDAVCVWAPQVDPVEYLSGEGPLPERGFFGVGNAASEFQALLVKKSVGEDPRDEALRTL